MPSAPASWGWGWGWGCGCVTVKARAAVILASLMISLAAIGCYSLDVAADSGVDAGLLGWQAAFAVIQAHPGTDAWRTWSPSLNEGHAAVLLVGQGIRAWDRTSNHMDLGSEQYVPMPYGLETRESLEMSLGQARGEADSFGPSWLIVDCFANGPADCPLQISFCRFGEDGVLACNFPEMTLCPAGIQSYHVLLLGDELFVTTTHTEGIWQGSAVQGFRWDAAKQLFASSFVLDNATAHAVSRSGKYLAVGSFYASYNVPIPILIFGREGNGSASQAWDLQGPLAVVPASTCPLNNFQLAFVGDELLLRADVWNSQLWISVYRVQEQRPSSVVLTVTLDGTIGPLEAADLGIAGGFGTIGNRNYWIGVYFSHCFEFRSPLHNISEGWNETNMVQYCPQEDRAGYGAMDGDWAMLVDNRGQIHVLYANLCEEGYWYESLTHTCKACPAGYSCPYGNYEPVPCPTGTFSSSGQSACTLCGVGTYAAESGSVTCSPCPRGTFSVVPAAVMCVQCSVGQFADSEGSTGCKTCPKVR